MEFIVKEDKKGCWLITVNIFSKCRCSPPKQKLIYWIGNKKPTTLQITQHINNHGITNRNKPKKI